MNPIFEHSIIQPLNSSVPGGCVQLQNYSLRARGIWLGLRGDPRLPYCDATATAIDRPHNMSLNGPAAATSYRIVD